jgi:nitrite reductase (NO-forming)
MTVPPGGAAAMELSLKVPGDFLLVDHAISRLEKGLAGVLHVDGAPNRMVFNHGPEQLSRAE